MAYKTFNVRRVYSPQPDQRVLDGYFTNCARSFRQHTCLVLGAPLADEFSVAATPEQLERFDREHQRSQTDYMGHLQVVIDGRARQQHRLAYTWFRPCD